MNDLEKVFNKYRVTKQGLHPMIENYLKFERDAKRYQWLKAKPIEDCTTPRIEVNVWTCNVNDDGVSDSVNEGDHPRQCAWPLSVLAGDALDAAIDAAMKENT